MGYVLPELSQPGATLAVDIRAILSPPAWSTPLLSPQSKRSQEVKPDKLLYAKTHEWVQVETGPAGEKIATVGLSDFALQALTDLVFMELPPVGCKVDRASPSARSNQSRR